LAVCVFARKIWPSHAASTVARAAAVNRGWAQLMQTSLKVSAQRGSADAKASANAEPMARSWCNVDDMVTLSSAGSCGNASASAIHPASVTADILCSIRSCTVDGAVSAVQPPLQPPLHRCNEFLRTSAHAESAAIVQPPGPQPHRPSHQRLRASRAAEK
jgi:hypothetical protein